MRGQKYIRNTAVICAMFAVVATVCTPAPAAVKVTEVLAGSNLDEEVGGTKMHNGDWFEITNTGDSAVTLSGWKWVDDKDTHALITIPDVTLAAGESVILLGEKEDDYTTDWQTVWGVTGQLITQGDMGGEFHGLGKSGDSVFLYDNNDVLVDTATWGSIGDGFSWDFVNSHLSVNGTDGAWTATDATGSDVASPYSTSTVPEPATLVLLTIGSGLLALRRRARRNN